MKNFFLNKKLKSLSVLLIFATAFSTAPTLLIQNVQAANPSRIYTSQADLKEGTADAALDLDQVPGDVRLKYDTASKVDTTVADFAAGNLGSGTAVANTGDGEVTLKSSSIDLGHDYSVEDLPVVGYDDVQHSFLDSSHNLLYISTYTRGVIVVDTKGNSDSSDDTLIMTYSTSSIPAIANNSVWNSFLDSTHNLLYVSTDGGLSVINTQGTIDPADDTLVKTYTIATTPAIADNYVNHTFLDSTHNLLYISTGGGLSVINTQGTIDPADDTLVKTYTTATIPAIGNNTVNHSFLDSNTHLLYVSTYGGLSVINTQGTINPVDDVLVKKYSKTSSPAISGDSVLHSFLDLNLGLLYISTYGDGLSVINTNHTINPADDTLVNVYSSVSLPAIGSNWVYPSFLDSVHNLLYASTVSGGLSVINTQGTIDPSDDILERTYLSSNSVRDSFLDASHNLLYISDSSGLSVIDLGSWHSFVNEYNFTGTYLSSPQTISATTPVKNLAYDTTQTSGQSTSLSYRTGKAGTVWRNDFDDNSTSEYAGDAYDWGEPFQTAVEDNGTMKLSNPLPWTSGDNQYVDTWIDTGKPDGYFPADSVVTARVRVNSQRQESTFIDAIFNDNWNDSGDFVFTDNQWQTVTFTSTVPFSKIGFDINWKTDTWNNATDNLEIDWIQIDISEAVASWNDWSTPCTTPNSCPIDPATLTDNAWFQYKLNLTTDDTTNTPAVNSVSFYNRYQTTGTYTSPVIDSDTATDWQNIAAETTIPEGTSITFSTRSGNTPAPDGTWSAWEATTDLNINSADSRYLQIQAVLATTDPNQTSVLSSFAVNRANYSTRTVTDPTPEKIQNEITEGFISIEGIDPINTPSFTFNVPFTIAVNEANVFFPADTTVTKTDGGNLDLTQLGTQMVQAQLDNSLGAIKLGIPHLNLTFSQPITITIHIGSEHNNETLQVFAQREDETTWTQESTCKVASGDCSFQTTHATTFAAQDEDAQKAYVSSWQALRYDKPDLKCAQRLSVSIKGKHFANNAEVKIGNQKAFSVNRKSSKEMTAKFCLEKLFNVKTDFKRTLSVTNPEADREKADKKVDLSTFLPAPQITISSKPIAKTLTPSKTTTQISTPTKTPVVEKQTSQQQTVPEQKQVETPALIVNTTPPVQTSTFKWWNPLTWW